MAPLRAQAGGHFEDSSIAPKKGSTVGRLYDLPWVGETTYSRFFRRPTVGPFLPPREVLHKRVVRLRFFAGWIVTKTTTFEYHFALTHTYYETRSHALCRPCALFR